MLQTLSVTSKSDFGTKIIIEIKILLTLDISFVYSPIQQWAGELVQSQNKMNITTVHNSIRNKTVHKFIVA